MVREREASFFPKPFQTLKFTLPAGEALSQPPLSAILGQAQINSVEFCKQFNSLSSNFYYPGVLINVSATKRSDNTIDIQIGDIFLPFVFFQAICVVRGRRKRRIYIETLYDLFQLYKTFQVNKILKPTSELASARKFLGVLRSARFKIKFL